MAQAFRYFIKGIQLRGNASDPTDNLEGSLFLNSVENRIKAYVQGAVRELVTKDQAQELTNKTLTSPVINTGVSGTAVSTDGTMAADSDTLLASQKAIKTYANSVGSTAQTNLNTHINTVTGAHAASAISNTPSGNLAATTVQAALNELQGDINTTNSTASAHISASTNVHGLAVGSSVVGTTDSQVLTNKTVTGADIRTPVRSDVKQGTRSDLDTYALTASNGQVVFATDEKQMFQVVDGILVAIGGADTVKIITGETVAVGDAVYASTGTGNDTSRIAGLLYKTDATNDSRVDVLGLVKKLYAGVGTTFSEGFESGSFTTNSWTVVNGAQVNKWAVGTATAQTGTYSAYISNDSGVTNNYTLSSASVTWIYKDVSVSSLQTLDFYYKLIGEVIGPTPFDYGRIIIDPTVSVVPVAGTDYSAIPLNGSNAILTTTANVWTKRSISLTQYAGTTVRIIFGWRNDGSTGSAPALAIDNIAVVGSPSADVQFSGKFTGYAGLSKGVPYYLSATVPGQITTAVPSVNAQWVVNAGLAASATELVINPVASASAIYNTDADTSFTIANNQTVTNITGLLLDGVSVRSALIDYSIYRKTDTALSAVVQIGQLRVAYNTQTSTWYLSDDYSAQNAGVTFSILSSGQIRYASTNIAGTNYSGLLRYSIRRSFGV